VRNKDEKNSLGGLRIGHDVPGMAGPIDTDEKGLVRQASEVRTMPPGGHSLEAIKKNLYFPLTSTYHRCSPITRLRFTLPYRDRRSASSASAVFGYLVLFF
jgi:hypothetical protein